MIQRQPTSRGANIDFSMGFTLTCFFKSVSRGLECLDTLGGVTDKL